jgi:hypothetical protein
MHAASKPAHQPLVVLHAATAMQVIRAATRAGNSGECVEAESQMGMGTTSSGSLTGPGFDSHGRTNRRAQPPAHLMWFIDACLPPPHPAV